jgi:poly(A) polymerase
MKLLAAENPIPALQLMVPLFPQLGLQEANLNALTRHQELFGHSSNIERLACLLWHTDMPATVKASRLHPTNRELKILTELQRHKPVAFNAGDPIAWAYRVGYNYATEQLRCRIAHGEVSFQQAKPALEKINDTPPPEFPVTGDDLIKAGIQPGPALGAMLARLEDWWLNHGRPTRTACLRHLNEIQ